MNDYKRIEDCIGYLDQHFADQPSLKEISDHVGLSESHFQRLFKRWAGISPKRFVQYLTAQYSGALLRDSRSTLSTSLESGLSSSSRLHDLMVNVYAMSPEQYRSHGKTLSINYGWHSTPFGTCLAASTTKGICWMSFPDDQENGLKALQREWNAAELIESPQETASIIDLAFGASPAVRDSIMLHVKGTNLQIRVWEALLKIPFGQVVSYSDVACKIEHPKAVRAVASAIGRNPVSYIIPCHRVLRKTGALGGYEWGVNRKRAMLAWESATYDNVQRV